MSFEHNKEIGTMVITVIVAIGIIVYLVLPSSKADDIIILSNGDGTAPVSCIGGNLILAQNLTDLCDVVITNPSLNQTIIYNGSYWVNMNFTGGGETTICSNLGTSQSTSEGIVSTSLNGNCTFKRLLEGNSISLSSNSTHITITNTAPDNTACFNVGSGLGVYSGGECQFDSLIAGDGITITDTTDDLTFTSTCENTGTGEPVCESDNNINSLIAGNNTSIVDTTGDLTIHSLITGNLAGEVGLTPTSITKTNIGTSYVDLYPCATISQNMNCFTTIDCSRALQLFIRFSWDHVGIGNQQFRIVDFNSDANVLWESPSFTTDQSTGSTVTYIDKPSWCTSSIQSIQAQGKSDVGTDDPIFYMYRVYMR